MTFDDHRRQPRHRRRDRPQLRAEHVTAERLPTATERRNSVTAKEIAKQYGVTIGYVYKVACLHRWRRTRKGRLVYYDVLEVGRTLGQ